MLLDLLFPERCLNCNIIIDREEIICWTCFDQINFTHWKFNEDNPLKQKCNLMFPVEQATALMHFEKDEMTQHIIHDLKYRSREKVGKHVANWVMEKIDFGEDVPDLLVPIPLHLKKERKRGYNQLHLFSETLSEELNIPLDKDLLKQNYYKKSQVFWGRKRRSLNENQFSINKAIDDKHVLLIDDVFTTGNTIAKAAWEILKSGNNKVSVLVMAVD